MSKFQVGQVWTNSGGRWRETIVAITEHPVYPIITQDSDGDVSAYTAEGCHVFGKRSPYDLSRQGQTDPLMASVDRCKGIERLNGMDTQPE